MRDILFKGKRKDNGEWVEGFVFITRKNTYNIKWYNAHHGSSNTSEVIPETVGQYTGLTDKNGKKIFEGDIARYSIIVLNTIVHEQIVKITFKKGSFCMEEMNGVSHPLFYNKLNNVLEVIGNIHDNPELLEN